MGRSSKIIFDLSPSLSEESLSILRGSVLLSVRMTFRSSALAQICWLFWAISAAFPASLSHFYLDALHHMELPLINQPVIPSIILHVSRKQETIHKSRASLIFFNQRRCFWTSSLVIITISRAKQASSLLWCPRMWSNIFLSFALLCQNSYLGPWFLGDIQPPCLLRWWPQTYFAPWALDSPALLPTSLPCFWLLCLPILHVPC